MSTCASSRPSVFGSFARNILVPVFALLVVVSATAQTPASPQALAPEPLITQPIDESHLTTLTGNTHPLARPEFDLGTAPASLPMERMLLVLKRSPQQEAALRTLLDNQQDKHSPSYHKWLTPDQFGKQFGPTDQDMATITAWLQSHGFQVGSSHGRTVLEFSGSASQVQEAFHTTIHKYVVNGEQHWANANDPSIPTALTPAVTGVLTLHNFLKKPTIHVSKQPVSAKLVQGKKKPELTFSNGEHGLGPYDFATIYNSPAFNGRFGGTGVIGLVGRSDLYNGGQDVSNFASVFGCCGIFETVLNGPDPGDSGGGDEAEATLDTTWAGAVAPWAQAALVVSGSTNTTDGVDLSEVYIIENDFADIMSESFGSCEADTTSANATGISLLAEQAAAQGITYFVSTGDNGAEGCDDPDTETAASGPISVNVLASTAFNVAAGGTVFNEGTNSGAYWSTSNTSNESALSYIPEDVWNDSCASPCSDPNISAGSGGESTLVSQPSWQSGVTGLPTPTGGGRYLPDVSLTAASHDPYLLCLEGSCVPNSQGEFYVYFVWGTSASAPSFAGIMALVDDELQYTTGSSRLGAVNYILYRLAASENGSLSSCNASSQNGLPASSCIFHDVTVGNNAVPGELNYGSSSADYQAGVGFDLATGLGSVNVSNLMSEWSTVNFNPTTTALTINNGSAVNVTHGTSIPVNVLVTSNSGTGTPSGDVALIAATGLSNLPTSSTGLAFLTLGGGSAAGSVTVLPGGTYTVTAQYAGDGTFAPSTSGSVSVTVTPEPSTTTLSAQFSSPAGQALTSPIPFGSLEFLRVDVAGKSQQGVPTGSVTFSDTFGPLPSANPQINPPVAVVSNPPLNSQGNTSIGDGVINFDAGNHSISASYSGDASFNASSSAAPLTFTVQPGFAMVPWFPGPATVNIAAPGGSGTTNVGIVASTGFSTPVTFTCSGLPAEAQCSSASATGQGPATIVSTTITVTTTAPHAELAQPNQHRYYFATVFAGGLPLAGLFLLVSPKRRRRAAMLGFMVLALLILIPACGGGSHSGVQQQQDPGTPAGTYNVIVTGTANGAPSQQIFFYLVVQ